MNAIMTTEKINWTLKNFYSDKVGTSCESCGHYIKEVFVIQSGETVLKVGSDCVNQFLSQDAIATVELITRRMKRAATQYRKNEPAAKSGESRDEYINRRVAEMGNARAAFNHIHKMVGTKSKINENGIINRFMCMYMPTFVKPEGYHEKFVYLEQWREIQGWLGAKRYARNMDRIGKMFNANRYDFDRPVWEVRKI